MLRELFAKNKNIVINTDIDGILSGIMLVKYCNCRIVGFTNSRDTVWLADGYDDLYKHVYVDMFVTDDRAICIDQHIVAVNAIHQQKIKEVGNKYSPQIEGSRDLSTYDSKYPFGTVQYIIAQLESEGITVELPDLNTFIDGYDITIGDILHRADDAMNTTLYGYVKNATFWWDWLNNKSNKSMSLKKMIDYLDGLKGGIDKQIETDGMKHKKKEYTELYKKTVDDIKKKTKDYFKKEFFSKSGDGGFNQIVDNDGNILPNILKYIETIAALFDLLYLNVPNHYVSHEGTYCRTRYLDIFNADFLNDYTICGHKVFSYAFIFSPEADGKTNFSFTIDMK